eukprot:XP_025015419.1 B3 domain-containing transcription factor VRN1-like [Ricinus communis]
MGKVKSCSSMASLHKIHNGILSFKENTPHLFKIILDKTIRDGKLGVPKKFARKYGKNLSSLVLLKIFDGSVWQVELTKSDGGIWLQKGWQEFAKHYPLAHGHLLIFEFHQRSSSHFNVLIFDKSASEIDYPSSNINHENERSPEKQFQEPKTEETENDPTLEILDGILPCDRTKRKSPLQFPQPHKIMKIESSSLTYPTARKVEDQVQVDLAGKRGYGVMSSQKDISSQMGLLQGHRDCMPRKKPELCIEQVLISNPENLFHTIPASFASQNLDRRKGNEILNVMDGRTWYVRYYIPNLGINRYGTAKISHGWRVFALDNQLEVGDVCAFESIKDTKTTFKVCIFRCNELIQIASCSNPPGAIEAANEFTSNHPFFKVVMSSSYIETGNLVRFSSNMHSFKGKRKINSRLYIIRKIARQPMGISSMVLSCI